MKQTSQIAAELNAVALRDDTQYFADYREALATAKEQGMSLPPLPDFSVFSNRYRDPNENGAGDQMEELYTEAEDAFLEAYQEVHERMLGCPPSTTRELTHLQPIIAIVGQEIKPTPSADFLNLEKEYFQSLSQGL